MDKVERARDLLENIQLQACNHGGWVENNPMDGVSVIHDWATEALALLSEPLAERGREADLREALEAAPIIGRDEAAEAFRVRQDAWLNGQYRAALREPSNV